MPDGQMDDDWCVVLWSLMPDWQINGQNNVGF